MFYYDDRTSSIIFLNVLVKPGSKELKFTKGVDELVIHLKSSPVKGKANKELISYLSKIFDVKKNQIKIVKGLKNRSKVVELSDISEDTILKALNK